MNEVNGHRKTDAPYVVFYPEWHNLNNSPGGSCWDSATSRLNRIVFRRAIPSSYLIVKLVLIKTANSRRNFGKLPRLPTSLLLRLYYLQYSTSDSQKDTFLFIFVFQRSLKEQTSRRCTICFALIFIK